MKQPLQYQAAKFAMGNLNADEIKSIIHGLVDGGFYLDEFLDALDARKPRMEEVLPAFIATLNHNGISLPDKEQAVWILIEFHLRKIALEGSDSLEELAKLIADVYWNYDFHTPTQKYLGDSHGIENLIGLYWAADDLRDSPKYISYGGKYGDEALSDLKYQIVVKAKHWLSAHRPAMNQYEVVRVVCLRGNRSFHPSVTNLRAPEVGDIGTILEVYTQPEVAYEVECSDSTTGITNWLEAMYSYEIELVQSEAN